MGGIDMDCAAAISAAEEAITSLAAIRAAQDATAAFEKVLERYRMAALWDDHGPALTTRPQTAPKRATSHETHQAASSREGRGQLPQTTPTSPAQDTRVPVARPLAPNAGCQTDRVPSPAHKQRRAPAKGTAGAAADRRLGASLRASNLRRSFNQSDRPATTPAQSQEPLESVAQIREASQPAIETAVGQSSSDGNGRAVVERSLLKRLRLKAGKPVKQGKNSARQSRLSKNPGLERKDGDYRHRALRVRAETSLRMSDFGLNRLTSFGREQQQATAQAGDDQQRSTQDGHGKVGSGHQTADAPASSSSTEDAPQPQNVANTRGGAVIEAAVDEVMDGGAEPGTIEHGLAIRQTKRSSRTRGLLDKIEKQRRQFGRGEAEKISRTGQPRLTVPGLSLGQYPPAPWTENNQVPIRGNGEAIADDQESTTPVADRVENVGREVDVIGPAQAKNQVPRLDSKEPTNLDAADLVPNEPAGNGVERVTVAHESVEHRLHMHARSSRENRQRNSRSTYGNNEPPTEPGGEQGLGHDTIAPLPNRKTPLLSTEIATPDRTAIEGAVDNVVGSRGNRGAIEHNDRNYSPGKPCKSLKRPRSRRSKRGLVLQDDMEQQDRPEDAEQTRMPVDQGPSTPSSDRREGPLVVDDVPGSPPVASKHPPEAEGFSVTLIEAATDRFEDGSEHKKAAEHSLREILTKEAVKPMTVVTEPTGLMMIPTPKGIGPSRIILSGQEVTLSEREVDSKASPDTAFEQAVNAETPKTAAVSRAHDKLRKRTRSSNKRRRETRGETQGVEATSVIASETANVTVKVGKEAPENMPVIRNKRSSPPSSSSALANSNQPSSQDPPTLRGVGTHQPASNQGVDLTSASRPASLSRSEGRLKIVSTGSARLSSSPQRPGLAVNPGVGSSDSEGSSRELEDHHAVLSAGQRIRPA